MKRIKLCWSIARIINAHTDADTEKDSEGKNKYAGIYIYKYKYIYKTDYQGTQEHLLSGLRRTGANCQMLAKQKTAAVSGLWQRSWRGYQFQFPLPWGPFTLPCPCSHCWGRLKGDFLLFVCNFQQFHCKHTHIHRQKHVYRICPLTLH